jgi:hypothetical protein
MEGTRVDEEAEVKGKEKVRNAMEWNDEKGIVEDKQRQCRRG